MAANPRLKGQDVSIRILQDAQAATQIDSIGSFNDSTELAILEQGFLGEFVNRFDDILNGFGGDMEIQLTASNWTTLRQAMIDRATRSVLGTVFNVVRVDLFDNGDSITWTYTDVKWGAMPTTVSARGDFVKVKLSFKCSELPFKVNALP